MAMAGAPERDAEGNDTLPGVQPYVREGGVEIAFEEDADVAEIAQEFQRTKLNDLGSPP
jgi:hypothetical protein